MAGLKIVISIYIRKKKTYRVEPTKLIKGDCDWSNAWREVSREVEEGVIVPLEEELPSLLRNVIFSS